MISSASRAACPFSSSKPLFFPFLKYQSLVDLCANRAKTPATGSTQGQSRAETQSSRVNTRRRTTTANPVTSASHEHVDIAAFHAQIDLLDRYRARYLSTICENGQYNLSVAKGRTWTKKLTELGAALAELQHQGVLLPPETLHRLFTAVMPRAELGQVWPGPAVLQILGMVEAARGMGIAPPSSLAADLNHLLTCSPGAVTRSRKRQSYDITEAVCHALLDFAIGSKVPGLTFVPLVPVVDADGELSGLVEKQRQYCAMSAAQVAAWAPGGDGCTTVAHMAWFVLHCRRRPHLAEPCMPVAAAFARRLASEPRLQQQWGEWGQCNGQDSLTCMTELLSALPTEPQLQAQLLRLSRERPPNPPPPSYAGELTDAVLDSDHPAVLCEGVQLLGLEPGYWELRGGRTLLGRAVAVLRHRLHWFSDEQVAAMMPPLLQAARHAVSIIAADSTSSRQPSEVIHLAPVQLEVLLRRSTPPYKVNGLLALGMGPPGDHPARGPAVDGDPSLDLLARMAVRVAAYLAGPHSEERDALRRALGLT